MVYHKHKLIFTGVPKNASSSVHTLLRNLTDHEHHHRSIIDDFNMNDADLMESYTSFTIIRNPYDRFISACYQIFRDRNIEYYDYNSIIEEEIRNRETDYMNVVFHPQYRFVGFGNKILVDNILSYETLEKDWKNFSEEHNKTAKYQIKTTLPLRNESNDRESWEEAFDKLSEDNKHYINEFYQRDFKLFKYKLI